MQYPFTAKPLPYSYENLNPFLNEQVLHFHHDKHYETYVSKLNEILKNYPNLQNMSLEDLLIKTDELPCEAKVAIKNNAGGVYNHELYFSCMNSNESELPTDKLALAIHSTFGSIEQFRSELKTAAINQFGSGYAWLILSNKKLEIISTPNQDTPISDTVTPLLCIDIWEHAYYLQYQNKRADYVENWFQLINWSFIGSRYMSLMKKI